MNIWSVIALIAGLAAAFALDAAKAQTAESYQELDCVINPSAIVEVSSAAPGVLRAVHSERSQRVNKGQLLAELDSTVEQAELTLAEARAEIDTMVKLRQASLKYDNRILNRLTSVGGENVVTSQELDVARREAVLSNWRLQDARDLRHLRQLELIKAKAVMARRRIQSPIDGVVIQRLRSPGEYVEEQPIFRLAQLDPLHVEVIAPMGLFRKVEKGMLASIVAETAQDESYTATVEVVDPMGDAAAGTFGLRLELPNLEHQIPAGVKCRVRFRFDQIVSEDPVPNRLPPTAAAPAVASKGVIKRESRRSLVFDR
jgi:RND family efflux transporter MFP subunit